MIGITGANGRLGTSTIKHLASKVSSEGICAFVRNPDKTKELHSLGVQIRIADYDSKQSFFQGLQGIDTLLLISSHDVGRRFNQHKNVIDAAKKVHVKRLVYTSFVMTKEPDWTLLREHYETEEYIKSIFPTYLICRNSHYTEPMIADMSRIIAEGVYNTSASNGFAYVSIQDLARTFAELLIHDDKVPANQTISLTGPELVTPKQYFELVQSQTDKSLNFNQLTEDQMKEYLVSIGISSEGIDGWLGFERMQTQGIVSVISDDIEKITGIKPQMIEEFLKNQ